ncbi:MAG: efflux RND transporter periplasmic adaptor subunit [Paracoccaceae bacterium]|nr:efflux RND transporter periplasmic adaptor subunit [Paracoccaceae bacterium]
MRLTSLLLAALLVGGLYYWFGIRGPGADPASAPQAASSEQPDAVAQSAPDKPVPVMVLESRAEPTSKQLILRGRTVAVRNVSVPAETAGLVISQPLHKGTEVSENDILCRLDPGARMAQLLEAEARLAEARVEAEAATALSEKGFAAETTLKARQAQLEAAQAQVNLVRLDIARLVIRAPFDGVLETDTAEIGSRLGTGDTCATIIDLSGVKVSGYVSEQEVDQVAVGRNAEARLINGRQISGQISFISRVSDPETRTYLVEVTLPNGDGRIRDGMTAELEIGLPPEIAHKIPQNALTLDDDGRLGVRLANDGEAQFVPIRIIGEETDGVWVAGLPETATVIVVGQEFVRNGRAIIAAPLDRTLSQ